ncbi:MAG: hypothetical protein Q8Q03_02250, partial [bacterium]|nr:hypothetical protein [bacterium]
MDSNNRKVKKNDFRPIESLEGKRNYKIYYRIERDGSTTERVFLNVPSISLREEIICKHYLSFLGKNFIQETIGVNFKSRDNPWDFELELSNGSKFNLEITSIADSEWWREKTKREETFEKMTRQKKIKFKFLKKMISWFGEIDDKQQLSVKNLEEEKVGLTDLIPNPFLDEKARIYISDSKTEETSFKDIVCRAINNKNKKLHEGKEKTVLVIDNRTSKFNMSDYQDMVEGLKIQLGVSLFPEIYLYTGYYSDDDGQNAEYSFAPMKLPKEMSDK